MKMMMPYDLEQEYFPALECAVVTLSFPDGETQELPCQSFGDPDLDAAMSAVAERFRLDVEEMDVGVERRDVYGCQVFFVYHPAHGVLARISYMRSRF